MDAEVAVIGVGSVGSMTLWNLAKLGIDAIGFEQYGIGHDQAAAGGESRIFRTAYLEGPEYVPILMRAYELWRELEAESGHDLLNLNGGLMIGQQDSQAMRNVLASIRQFELPHEVLDQPAMADRYPQHSMLPGETAILDKRAGVLRPEFAVSAAAYAAEAHGAKLISHATVTDIRSEGDRVTIRTPDREYTARQAIITAGPWSSRFVPKLKSHVTPYRLVMTWYLAREPANYTAEKFPIFIRDTDDAHVFGIPTLDSGSVKVAPHAAYGAVHDPDNLNRTVEIEDLENINAVVAKYLPGLIPNPVRVSAYMDGYTTDGQGLVGRAPGEDNVWILSGFSGHGFKMSTALGQIGAELATDGRTALPIGHLDPARFAD
ncbi:N-methyl-L-tryptophan oxidase [Spelaeicoccus albus]|uniref:Sarcosine oxidase n=1 Tax=Spelaeicoccus albus TaxID=1280376 RepID=A0A7Z0D4M9_9MICO|nr:N-methyl-L-tryptophan oxidase [Spelaeicoccus albus]NYI68803.1 sarcosine oxidase [Spelaeicoccus albus]